MYFNVANAAAVRKQTCRFGFSYRSLAMVCSRVAKPSKNASSVSKTLSLATPPMTISQSYDVISSKSQTTISAASLTNVPLLIAVKTTNTEEYTVNPRIFILDPFEKQEIKIDCCKVNITRKKDKFLFTGYELTKEDANSKVENIYKRIKAYSSQYKSYSVKREVQFEELSEKEIEEKDNLRKVKGNIKSSKKNS